MTRLVRHTRRQAAFVGQHEGTLTLLKRHRKGRATKSLRLHLARGSNLPCGSPALQFVLGQVILDRNRPGTRRLHEAPGTMVSAIAAASPSTSAKGQHVNVV